MEFDVIKSPGYAPRVVRDNSAISVHLPPQMKGYEIIKQLRVHVDELRDTIDKSVAVRSFVEQNLLPEEAALVDQVELIYSLIEKSEAITNLVDKFLSSDSKHSEFVFAATELVNEAKAEIKRFQENKFLSHFDDVTDETDTIQ